MGATCSSCCWSDRRASDVVHGDDTLQAKLLDHQTTDECERNSATLEDSTVNPYSRSLELRAKEAWPRPLVTPSSEYVAYEEDDTDRSGYGSDDRSSRGSSASTNSSPLNHAWNLRAAGSGTDASFVDVQTMDDSTSAAAADIQAALPTSSRSLSASGSMRSSADDSYASIRELPTYESLLFADDIKNSSPKARGSQDSDDLLNDGDNDDDDETADLDRNSVGGGAPSTARQSAAHGDGGIGGARGSNGVHRKRSY